MSRLRLRRSRQQPVWISNHVLVPGRGLRSGIHADLRMLGLTAAAKVTLGQTAETMRDIQRATPEIVANIKAEKDSGPGRCTRKRLAPGGIGKTSRQFKSSWATQWFGR